MVFQREFFPTSLLQPEAHITALALPVRRGSFVLCVPLALAVMCGDGGTVQSRSGWVLAGLDWVLQTTRSFQMLLERCRMLWTHHVRRW